MAEHPIEADLKKAALAVRHAKDVRTYHARRTEKGSPQREDDLAQAADRIRKAMRPLRTHLGRAPWDPNASHNKEELLERVREASKQLQGERRRLWKMRVREEEKERENED